MLRTTLAGIRARFARLVLSSIAIVVGVAFVSGTMVLADALQATMRDEFARSARGVDAVVEPSEKAVPDVAAIRAVDGVAAAELRRTVPVPIVGAQGRADEADLVSLTADPALRPQEIKQGALPSAGQIAVSEHTARDRGLAVGSEVVLLGRDSAPVRFVVSGVYDSGTMERPGSAQVLLPDITPFADPAKPAYDTQVVVRSSGADQAMLVERLQTALGDEFQVTTGVAYTEYLLARYGGTDDIALAMTLFAVVALIVAAMVVLNTFTILIAQRTRELGLLRSIGAQRRQIFRSCCSSRPWSVWSPRCSASPRASGWRRRCSRCWARRRCGCRSVPPRWPPRSPSDSASRWWPRCCRLAGRRGCRRWRCCARRPTAARRSRAPAGRGRWWPSCWPRSPCC